MMFKPYNNLNANVFRPVSRDKRTSNKCCANFKPQGMAINTLLAPTLNGWHT